MNENNTTFLCLSNRDCSGQNQREFLPNVEADFEMTEKVKRDRKNREDLCVYLALNQHLKK